MFNPFPDCWGHRRVVPHQVDLLAWSLHLPFSPQGQTPPEAYEHGLPKSVYYWCDVTYFDIHCSVAQNKTPPLAVSWAPGSRSLETSGLPILALSSSSGQDHCPPQEIWCPEKDVLAACSRSESAFLRDVSIGSSLGQLFASLLSSKGVGCWVFFCLGHWQHVISLDMWVKWWVLCLSPVNSPPTYPIASEKEKLKMAAQDFPFCRTENESKAKTFWAQLYFPNQ